MNNSTRVLITTSVILMMAFNAYSQDIFKTSSMGIGTTTPAQKLEIAGSTNTIRIDGLVAGGTYNPLSSAANTSSNLVYVNNATGDIYALPSGSAGSILMLSTTGAPTWVTPSVAAVTAWALTGNNGITTPTAPAVYGTSTITSGNWLGTTDGNDVVFGTKDIERMRIGGGSVATAGFVGIGTSTPANDLDVAGSEAIGTYVGTAAPAGGLIVSGKVGIGTATPSTAKGMGLLQLGGVSSSVNGPTFQTITTTDPYPITQFFNYSHDNEGVMFDSYYNGTTSWVSSFTGTIYQLYKTGGKLFINYATGTTQGSNITLSNAVTFSAGFVGIGTSTPANDLDVAGSEAIGTYVGTAAPAGGLIVSGKVGIGTATPSTAKGMGLLQLGGASSSVNGPTFQTTTTTDPYPITQFFNYSHDNEGVMFDSYYNGTTSWVSSFTGTIYQLYKTGGKLFINYATGTTQGSNITLSNAVTFSAGFVGIGTSTPANDLDVAGSEAVGTYAGTAAPASGLIVSGKVGIGTSTPAQAIQVVGNVQFSQALMPNGTPGSTGNILLSAGAATAPTWLADGTTGQVLESTGTGTAPTWATQATSVGSVSVTAPIVNIGSSSAPNIGIQGTNTGGILYSTGSGNSAVFTSSGTSGQVLQSNGTGAPTWGSANSVLTTSSIVAPGGSSVVVGNGTNQVVGASNVLIDVQGTSGGIFYGTGAGIPAVFTSSGTSGQVLQSNGTSAPTWVTVVSAPAWTLSGNTGITTPTAPVIYGTSTITSGQNYIGTTDGNDIVVGTNGVERMRVGGGNVATAGYVGVGTPTPNSTMQINGSMSIAVKLISSDYTASATDYFIQGNCSGGPITLTLPDATTMQGRLYYIDVINPSGTNILTIVTTGTQVIGTYGTSMTLINNYEQEYVVSDGSNWNIISGSKM